MNEVERLAFEQAIYNAIGKDVKTGDPHNLRGAVTAHYLGLYEEYGSTGFDVRIGGESVGRFTFPRKKGQPERTETVLQVTDASALMDWKSDDFDSWCKHWFAFHREDLALQYAQETGELPDGVEWVSRTEPAVPETINEGGRLVVDARKVAKAMEHALPPEVIGLLEESEE